MRLNGSFSRKPKKTNVDNSIQIRGKPLTKTQNSIEETNNTLLIDDTGKASSDNYLIVGSYVDRNDMKAYRNVKEKFPKKKDGNEVKYSNTNATERIKIYRELDGVPYEIWDSSESCDDMQIMKDAVLGLIGKNSLPDDQIRYIYKVFNTIRDVNDLHHGKMDITIDNPPYNIKDELMKMCNTLRSRGYNIIKCTIKPSRIVIELQVHDFVAGLDRDIRNDFIDDNPNLSKTSEMDGLIARFKKRFMNKRFP